MTRHHSGGSATLARDPADAPRPGFAPGGGLLARIVERASQEIYVLDAHTLRFVDANRAARENMGYSLDELRSMTPLDINPQVTAVDIATLLGPLFSGERETVTLNGEHRRKDGTRYPTSVRIELDRSEGRDLLVAFVTDRSDFAELTAQMRLAVSAARFHFTNWDLRTGRIERDPEVDRLYGFPDHDPGRMATDFRARVNPHDLVQNLERFDAVRRGERAEFDTTFRVVHPGGEQRWLRAVGRRSELSPEIIVGLQCDVTEAVLAAQAREKSERDLQNLFRSIPDYVSRARPDTTLTFANEPYARFLGAEPADLIGRRFLDMVPEPHRAELREQLASLTPDAPTVTNVEHHTARDGSDLCLLWTNLMVFEDGEPVELISVGRDITAQDAARRTIEAQARELAQSNEALRASEERFQLAVRAASVGVWDWQIAQGNHQFLSDRIYELIGFAPGEIQSDFATFFVDRLHPEDRERTLAAIDRHLADGSKYECEFRMRTKGGDYRWFLDTGEAARDADGRAVRMVGTMMDIHDRKAAEAELRVSEERFQLAVMGSSVGVWDWRVGADSDLFWSDKLYELLGYAPGEVPATSDVFNVLLHPEDRERTQAAIDAHLAGGGRFECEYRMRHKSGEYRWFLDTGHASRDADGRAVRMVGTMMDIHDRKMAEAELKRSEERFKVLYNDTPVMLHSVDTERRLVAVSDYWLEQMGYTRDEVIGRQVLAFLSPESRQRFLREGAPALETDGHLRDFAHQLVRKDGTTIDCLLSAVRMRNAAGGHEQTLGVATDVTERKRIADALARQQRELQLIFDHAPVRIWYKDDQNRVLRLNKRAAQAIGMSVESAEGISVYERAPEVARQYHIEDLAVIRSGKPMLGIVEQVTTADGRVEWTRTDKVPYVDPETGRTQLLATSTDITELKNAELRLARQKRELELIFDNVPVKIFYKDEENRILRLNRRAAESLGKTVEELEGASVYELFPAMAEKYHADDLAVITSGRAKLGIVEEYAPAEGERGWASTDKVPYTDPDTGRRNILVTATDITDLKNAEVTMAEQAEALRRSNEELEQFAYVASHDLKAPLRGIDNLASWIEEDMADRMDAESRSNMALLRGRVARLESLLDGLLQFSRVGRSKTEVTRVDLAEVAAEVFDLVRGDRPFALRCGEMPSFTTGLVPLQLVLRNLISNAIKHHDRGEGTIAVSAADLGARYRITVADDGPGIDLAFHARIFGMFQVLKPRDEVEGSGLGLAIIEKQLRTLGCEIGVESDPRLGRGAEFHFTWPKRWPYGMPSAAAA